MVKPGSLWFCVAVCLMVTLAGSLPAYQYPTDWSSEDYLAYLMKEQEQQLLRPVENTLFNTDHQELGMISGIDLNSSGILHVFHRADRVWDIHTFTEENTLSEDQKETIALPTIFAMDPVTGKKVGSFGEGLFNMPHGLKFDQQDNLWLTDVGRHQVFRIPKGSTKPDMTLGEAFVPGYDDQHFCKPTDVVVASTGDFFVADGYCNRRIMKFDKTGKLITKIGMTNTKHVPSYGPDPYAFNTPHSLTLVENLDLLCVADRDNLRSLCFNAGLNSELPVGAFNRTLIAEGEIGKVYSIYYNKADNDVIAAGEVSSEPFRLGDAWYFPARAHTYGLDGMERAEWAYITPEMANRGPSLIHALCTSKDGQDYFLADQLQRKVYKYSKLVVPPSK